VTYDAHPDSTRTAVSFDGPVATLVLDIDE